MAEKRRYERRPPPPPTPSPSKGAAVHVHHWASPPAQPCICGPDVEVGNYRHNVSMKIPFPGFTRGGGLVEIDVCIATEIAELWHQGVCTMASCCGHGDVLSWVCPHPDSLPLMRELGYVQIPGDDHTVAFRLRSGTGHGGHR